MKIKRFISLLAATAMAVTAITGAMTVSVVSAADSYVASGKIGENASWVINTDDVLVISGQGDINGSGGWGWINLRDECLIDEVVVEDGITSVTNTISSNWALIGSISCQYVSKITLPPSLTKLQGCLNFVECFKGHHLKDIYIYSKNVTDTAYQSTSYPGGITWHVYKDSETDKSLRNDLGLTGEDIEYIPDNEKMPAITNKTPAEIAPLTETSGPAGVTSKWEWNESSKTLTFSGAGYIYGYGDRTENFTGYKKYSEKTEHIVIKSGITSIGLHGFIQTDNYSYNGAFCNFTALKDVELPDTLRIIGDGVFGKSNLTKIEFPQTVEKIGREAFSHTELEGELAFSENVKRIEKSSFCYTKIKSINFHEGMFIGGGAFEGCESLKEVTIPKNCTYGKNVGQGGSRPHATFSSCTGLEKVIIEDGVTDLAAQSMFGGCTALKDVYFYTSELQSIVGSNTPYAEGVYTFSTYKNITFHVIKGSTTEQTLKDAGYLNDENTEYLTNFAELETAIAEAEKKDKSAYTDETVSALKKAIENGKTVLNNENATQDEVDKAVNAITAALSGLAKKPAQDSVKPGTAKPSTTTPNVKSQAQKNAENAMKQAKITKLTVKSKAKRKITVTWKKVSKANGYQVQVSTNKKFKKSKIILTKTTSKKKITIKKLKSKKTYFVRVRAYATYKDSNGKPQKVYSSWIKKTRKVKVK